MVRGVNKVILLGNTAAEPDFRVLSNGSTSIATVGLATNESYRDQNGNITEQTEWHRLVFWGRTAEIARDYMRKGSQIYVEGKIKTRSYEDQQGIKRYTTEIHVTELHLLSSKQQGNGGYPNAGFPQPGAYQNMNGYPQNGGFQQAPGGYQQQGDYPQQSGGMSNQGGYRNNSGYPQRGGFGSQMNNSGAGNFRNATPAGAVPLTPPSQELPEKPVMPQPSQAMPNPSSFQIPENAGNSAGAPSGEPALSDDGDNRPFKDDDLPF